MATKPVQIKSGPKGEYSIYVNHPLLEANVGDKIKFINQLTGSPTATIALYVVDGDVKSKADGLCEGVSGNTLTIAGSGNVDCIIEYGGYIKYDIMAADHTSLDPVVIIDKTVSFVSLSQFSGLESQFQEFVQDTNSDIASLKEMTGGTANFDGMTLALVAIGAVVVGYLIGKR